MRKAESPWSLRKLKIYNYLCTLFAVPWRAADNKFSFCCLQNAYKIVTILHYKDQSTFFSKDLMTQKKVQYFRVCKFILSEKISISRHHFCLEIKGDRSWIADLYGRNRFGNCLNQATILNCPIFQKNQSNGLLLTKTLQLFIVH